MTEPENIRTAFDNDFDNDSWLGKKEISFSTKLLVAIGGIASFGGLFPMAVEKTANLFDLAVGKGFFVCFSLGYFVLPLVVFLVWVWISDRVACPEKDDESRKRWSLKWFTNRFMNFPVTYRYQWIVLLHIICVSLYLTISIYFFGKAHGLGLIVPALLLIIAPIAALASFVDRNYPGKKFTKPMLWVLLIVVLSLVGWYLYTASPKHKHEKTDNYEDLIKVDQTSKKLTELEKQISNRVDRFYIKSAVQAEVTLDSLNTLPENIDSVFFIDPYLRVLGRIMLLDSVKTDCVITNEKMKDGSSLVYKHAHHYVLPDSTRYHALFLKPAYHFVFDTDRVWSQKERVILQNDTFLLQNSKITLLELMDIVGALINGMIDRDEHRVFPDCIDTSTNILPIEREKISALLNLRNSKMLKDWVEHFYLPYCQRKAQADIEDYAQDTAWIWQDMQIRGIAISVTALLLLFLFYIELIDLKSYKIYLLDRNEPEAKDKEEKEKNERNKAEKISALNKKANYLLFPLTMTITIVGMLLIPVTTQMEISAITPSRSFWMMNVPSLHLPNAVQEVISIDTKNTDVNNDPLPPGPAPQTEEMKKLTESLDALRLRLDSLKIFGPVEVAPHSHKELEQNLRNQITKNQDSIQLLKDSIIILNQRFEDLIPK